MRVRKRSVVAMNFNDNEVNDEKNKVIGMCGLLAMLILMRVWLAHITKML